MQRKTSVIIALVVLTGLVGAVQVAAQGPTPRAPAAMGTAFTYQGQLKSGASPYTGTCDFQFGLFPAATLGTQIGSTQTATAVPVANGLFTTPIDFGLGAFDGNARYLDIGVRCPAGGGSYVPLTARQQLTAAPYAIKAASYANVITVAPSGGNFTSVQAALTSITTNSSLNRFLVYVGPGTYTETVTMKPYVDIEGAGELTTKITNTGSSETNTGTVVGANNAELRFFTVENTGANTYAIAIYNSSASPRLTHITATAAGGTNNIGVFNTSSSPTMTNVTANVAGGTGSNIGVRNISSAPTMTDVSSTASGGSTNFGVYNDTSAPTITNVIATGSGGTSQSYGMLNYTSALTMTNVIATASAGSTNFGVANLSSSLTIRNSAISGIGGTNNFGIHNSASSGAYTVLIDNSQIKGSTNTISNDSEFTTRVGASKLDGGAVSGAVTCIYAYNASYTALNPTCQ